MGATSILPGGLGALPSYVFHWNSFQLYDDAFWNRGTDSIKFGFAFERMALQTIALADANGVWYFDSLQRFLQNNPTKFQGGIASSVTPRDARQNLVGGYLQDDWRLKPNLTLNLGLRYEMSTVPTEINGRFVTLRNITDAVAHLGNPLFHNPTTKDFEPRVGFAWDVFRNGRLAVRGGVGLYDVQPLLYQFTLLQTQATPFYEYTVLKVADATLRAPLTFPMVPQQDITANKLQTTYIDPNPKRTYVGQWNLNVQYQLTPSLAGMVAYVGSRGVHQPFKVDETDLVIPTKTSAGYLWPQVDGAATS